MHTHTLTAAECTAGECVPYQCVVGTYAHTQLLKMQSWTGGTHGWTHQRYMNMNSNRRTRSGRLIACDGVCLISAHV